MLSESSSETKLVTPVASLSAIIPSFEKLQSVRSITPASFEGWLMFFLSPIKIYEMNLILINFK